MIRFSYYFYSLINFVTSGYLPLIIKRRFLHFQKTSMSLETTIRDNKISFESNRFKYFHSPQEIYNVSKDFNIKFREMFTLKSSIKCHCISDLHADTEKTQVWIKNNCFCADDKSSFNILILPGDVCSELDRLETVFKILVERYDLVCYVPGNHEAWRRGTTAGGSATKPELRGESRMASNSIEKLKEVLKCARKCGVCVGPVRVKCENEHENENTPTSVVIFPLYSWYHSGWDTEPDLTHPDFLAVEDALPFHRKWGDFSLCTWPEELVTHNSFASINRNSDSTNLAETFGLLNEPFLFPLSASKTSEIQNVHQENIFGSPFIKENETIISFSHFLPKQELCPEKRFLLEPMLSRVIGSVPLDEQIQRLKPHVHLFGHTHIPIDMELNDIRYIQWPLGYARESELQCAPVFKSRPLVIFDSAIGTGKTGIPPNLPSLDSSWSRYYSRHARAPDIVNDLAPWVIARLEKFSGFVYTKSKREAAELSSKEFLEEEVVAEELLLH